MGYDFESDSMESMMDDTLKMVNDPKLKKYIKKQAELYRLALTELTSNGFTNSEAIQIICHRGGMLT